MGISATVFALKKKTWLVFHFTYLDHLLSRHQCLTFGQSSFGSYPLQGSNRFHFENYWIYMNGFYDLVQAGWHSQPSTAECASFLSTKFKKLRADFEGLGQEQVKPPQAYPSLQHHHGLPWQIGRKKDPFHYRGQLQKYHLERSSKGIYRDYSNVRGILKKLSNLATRTRSSCMQWPQKDK